MASAALVGIGTLLLSGATFVAVTNWLAHRRHPVVHATGAGLAAAGAVCCGFVAFALMADNVGTRPRLAGTIVTSVFATVSVASLLVVARAVSARRSATGRSAANRPG